MIDTRSGTSTSPYTAEQDAKTAAILKEKKEKKEAKKKPLMEEQAAELRKIEEEMARERERMRKEQEEKLKAVEEEEEVEEQPLERRRRGQGGESSGTKEDRMEKKITEWVAGLSLGKEEEALMYVPREEQEATMREWDAEEDPLKRQAIEDEKRMEWKFGLTRERKRRMEGASQAAKELEEVKKQREQMETQVDLLGKMERMARNIERLTQVQEEQYLFGRGQDIALRSIRLGLRDFARELTTQVGSEVRARLEGMKRYYTGAIEGARLIAPKEEETRLRREPVKVKFSDSYSGAVLQQDDGNGYRPVEFMSARMPLEKVATSTYERELYALRRALEHWKHYLFGRHFKVYSVHETLRWLKTKTKMTPKLTRWAAKLDQYDFELKPVKGKYNVVADALSRRADYFGGIVHYLDKGRDLQ
ncbi:hypothetical protein CBR_g18798 [Chara braunii]|uniref:Reverse transcriptase RNase H-like domain-containing protein n=1 Tax=Chara braunii TaxID=69332 RepID=A0A388KWH0_CHABU|nr:hypothetical protein CBR_g18798 [Chara braunii]|eukprot:GBG74387.1 hypothetical protein CBR_g18798 [Chara braunii]